MTYKIWGVRILVYIIVDLLYVPNNLAASICKGMNRWRENPASSPE